MNPRVPETLSNEGRNIAGEKVVLYLLTTVAKQFFFICMPDKHVVLAFIFDFTLTTDNYYVVHYCGLLHFCNEWDTDQLKVNKA